MRLLVRMKFKSGFRVGRGNESDASLPTIHSDTIYGAIVYHAFLWASVNEAEDFAKNLKVSSLLFERDNDLLVPKPMSFNVKAKEKKVKKASYAFLKKILDGRPKEEAVCEEEPVEVASVPRNSLDRLTNSSNLYFVEISFAKEGFTPVVIAEFPDQYEDLFKTSVKSLGDSGIGADNTYGYGVFEAEFDKAPSLPTEGKNYLCLSLFLPSPEEVQRLNEGYYKVIKRRGMKRDQMKVKKELFYIQEGSVFPFLPKGRGVLKIDDYFVQTSPICVAFNGGDAA